MKKPRLALLVALICVLIPSVAACDTETDTTISTVSEGSANADGSSSVQAWTDLAPTGDVPAARAGHSMVYDPKTGKVLLFGGTDSEVFFDDTWAYDPATNTWTDLAPSGVLPPARCAAAMAYDGVGGKAILFGGTSGEALLNDTWAYDPVANAWTDLAPSGAPPSVRAGHAMVCDTTDGTVILFGGRNEEGFFDETWTYEIAANTWSPVETAGDPPTDRYGHSMVFEPAGGKAIITGGWDGMMYLSSTWAYDPHAQAWTSLDTYGDVPPPRAGHSVVYDSDTGALVLFGGMVGDRFLGDTRTYDPVGNTWSLLHAGTARPTARNGHAMTYVPPSSVVILFGGWNGLKYYNDTWSLGDRD